MTEEQLPHSRSTLASDVGQLLEQRKASQKIPRKGIRFRISGSGFREGANTRSLDYGSYRGM